MSKELEDDDESVAPENAGVDDADETAEVPAVIEAPEEHIDPALAIRAGRLGIEPAEMQELGPAALEKAVAVMERQQAASNKSESPAAEEDDFDAKNEDGSPVYDEKLVKFSKNTKTEIGQLRETVARIGAREAVADLLEDDATVPAELRTRKAINTVTEEMGAYFNKNPNAKWDDAYSAAREKVLGDKIKAAAQTSRKPTVTTPPAQKSASKLSQYELTAQRIRARLAGQG